MEKKHYRNEWKYSLSHTLAESIYQRLAGLMDKDAHSDDNGGYLVHSMYFDNFDDLCARENIAGERVRFKYRIRYYGSDSGHLYFERKEKLNSFCHKDSCPLTGEEFRAVMNADTDALIWSSDKQLLRKFGMNTACGYFMPKSIVEYERRALIEPISNVRITFDRNIFASDDFDLFTSGDYTRLPVSDPDDVILEVKFDEVLPSYIRRALQLRTVTQQAFSKYYNSRITIQDYHRGKR